MNKASDQVSDAETARSVLEVYCGERIRCKTKIRLKKWLPQALQVHPQVWQGCPQVQLRSANEQNTQICNVGSKSGLNAHGDRSYPGYGPRLWGYPIETKVEATSGNVVTVSGVEIVMVAVREPGAACMDTTFQRALHTKTGLLLARLMKLNFVVDFIGCTLQIKVKTFRVPTHYVWLPMQGWTNENSVAWSEGKLAEMS
ncbi:hypothetical protein FB451DRAFT_1170572 [Mycena latifolia]|nr:hypothetical protein FB451DRAFT_1170572 [Mycena latifolia]